jgi:hypothetical protein
MVSASLLNFWDLKLSLPKISAVRAAEDSRRSMSTLISDAAAAMID